MFKLPDLSYDYDALGKYISKDIMVLHHTKHHQGYVDKLNAALEGQSELQGKTLEELLVSYEQLPETVKAAVRNQGGGHYNHSLFWQWMSPNGGGEPSGQLAADIIEKYGSFQAFVDEFSAKALGVFGSGWVWLQPDLSIATTSNQDTPILLGQPEPLLGLDVWEHAYYLDYKNKRDDYVKAWWNVVNWDFVESRSAR
ncbi:superoxide dismutase [Candidatus Saccharibacteria bacterium]|jgi:Fe-Mn family superoxide dismutase|nr:superoxide dismutase [Candidatus Saccharibacteria bacterium]